jgi:hypothetical protein
LRMGACAFSPEVVGNREGRGRCESPPLATSPNLSHTNLEKLGGARAILST